MSTNHVVYWTLRTMDFFFVLYLSVGQIAMLGWTLAILIKHSGTSLTEKFDLREYFIVFSIVKVLGLLIYAYLRDLKYLITIWYGTIFANLITTIWAIYIMDKMPNADRSLYFNDELQLFSGTSIFDFIGWGLTIIHVSVSPVFCCIDGCGRYYNPHQYEFEEAEEEYENGDEEEQEPVKKQPKKSKAKKKKEMDVVALSAKKQTTATFVFEPSDEAPGAYK